MAIGLTPMKTRGQSVQRIPLSKCRYWRAAEALTLTLTIISRICQYPVAIIYPFPKLNENLPTFEVILRTKRQADEHGSKHYPAKLWRWLNRPRANLICCHTTIEHRILIRLFSASIMDDESASCLFVARKCSMQMCGRLGDQSFGRQTFERHSLDFLGDPAFEDPRMADRGEVWRRKVRISVHYLRSVSCHVIISCIPKPRLQWILVLLSG